MSGTSHSDIFLRIPAIEAKFNAEVDKVKPPGAFTANVDALSR